MILTGVFSIASLCSMNTVLILPSSIRLLFSDEAQFKLNGLVNRHNSVYYDTVNRLIHYETQLNQSGVLVWAGMSSFGMSGLYFFDMNCTEETYLHMLQNYLVPGLEATYDDKMTNGTLYFQHDGASTHYATYVCMYLDATFKAGVIVCRGSIECPLPRLI